MAGRPTKVAHVNSEFLVDIDSAIKLVQAVKSIEGINPRALNKLHSQQVRKIVELAFMGVVASWEEYLELIFVRYLAGSKSTSGSQSNLKIGKANTIPHAYRVVSGNSKYNSAKDYLKFSDTKWVLDKADFFFEKDHPFDSIRTSVFLLQSASIIRNRVAHNSEKCRKEFKDVAVDFTNSRNGNLTQGYRCGDLLLAPAIKHFGQQVAQSNCSYFDAYMNRFSTLANQLVA